MSVGQNKPLFVVVSRTPWTEPPRARQQVARQLARFGNVIYVEFPSGYRNKDLFETVASRITRYAPRLSVPIPEKAYLGLPLVHRMINRYGVRRIMEIIGKKQQENAVLVNFNFDFCELYDESAFCLTTYYCNDDLPGRPQSRLARRIARRYEEAVVSKAGICITVSDALRMKLVAYNKNVHVVLPGHEFHIRPSNLSLRNRNEGIRVCYMGYINARLRYDWLEQLLKSSDCTLFLIGPVHGVDITALLGFHNCKLVPPMEGESLYNTLCSMDVLVMPYASGCPGFYNCSAPNKLFQYLATGRPIVSSSMPNLVELPSACMYRAENGDEFVAQVYRAYHEDRSEFIDERARIASENTWDKRGQKIWEIVQEAIKMRGVC